MMMMFQDGWTALMKAAENGEKEMVEMLIEVKADMNTQNKVSVLL